MSGVGHSTQPTATTDYGFCQGDAGRITWLNASTDIESWLGVAGSNTQLGYAADLGSWLNDSARITQLSAITGIKSGQRHAGGIAWLTDISVRSHECVLRLGFSRCSISLSV